jgi:hypothetical protein
MRYAFPTLIPVVLCSCAFAADASLDEVKSTYQAQLDKITEANSAALTALDDQVLTALTRAEEAAKQAKDPAAAALTEEVARWKKEGGPTEESTVPAIAKIHQIYRSQKEAKTAERNKQVAAWFKSYNARLAGLKDADADDVKAEREKIGGSFLVKEALAAAPATGSSTPPPAAGGPKAPAPSLAPANQGPWQNLKKVKWASIEGNEYFKGGIASWKDPIVFNGKKYEPRDLIYTHGGGSVTYQFKTPITALKATGCMEERTGQGNVFFIIETDEGEVYRTKPVTHDHTAEIIDLTFKPTLKLVIKSDPNGGAQEDWAFLLEPKYR